MLKDVLNISVGIVFEIPNDLYIIHGVLAAPSAPVDILYNTGITQSIAAT
jgi:hypothetical protein